MHSILLRQLNNLIKVMSENTQDLETSYTFTHLTTWPWHFCASWLFNGNSLWMCFSCQSNQILLKVTVDQPIFWYSDSVAFSSTRTKELNAISAWTKAWLLFIIIFLKETIALCWKSFLKLNFFAMTPIIYWVRPSYLIGFVSTYYTHMKTTLWICLNQAIGF